MSMRRSTVRAGSPVPGVRSHSARKRASRIITSIARRGLDMRSYPGNKPILTSATIVTVVSHERPTKTINLRRCIQTNNAIGWLHLSLGSYVQHPDGSALRSDGPTIKSMHLHSDSWNYHRMVSFGNWIVPFVVNFSVLYLTLCLAFFHCVFIVLCPLLCQSQSLAFL